MTTYGPDAVTAVGTVPTVRTAASGDKIRFVPGAVLRVMNGAVSSMTATFPVPGLNAYGQPNPDPVVTIGASSNKSILLLPQYVDPADGLISITWSSTTTVTFTVERV